MGFVALACFAWLFITWASGPGSGNPFYLELAIPLAVILGASVAMYLSIRARVYQNGFEWRTVIAGKHGFTDVSALSATRRYLDLAFRNSNPIFIDTRTIGHGRDVCRAIIEGVQRDNPEAIQPSVYRHFGLLPGREEEADPA